MKGTLQLGLRAGERIYVNGAVLRVDRKVRIELLNDVTFLLESHVMQPEAATTPLRQLYFLIQGLLMDPSLDGTLRTVITSAIDTLQSAGCPETVQEEYLRARRMIEAGRVFDALKVVRGLLPKGDRLNWSSSEKSKLRQEVAA